jgi:hypothetical protein
MHVVVLQIFWLRNGGSGLPALRPVGFFGKALVEQHIKIFASILIFRKKNLPSPLPAKRLSRGRER